MTKAKKILSCVLCILMAFSCVTVAASAEEFESLPTVYIKGASSALTEKAHNSKSKEIYPLSIPDGYIGDACKKLAAPLGMALFTNNWDEYNDGLYEAMMPIAAPMALDKNGEASNGSGSKFSSSKTPGRIIHAGMKISYAMEVWSYDYDWRLDPIASADGLHDYIEFVKTKNHVDKVNILARCLAGNIMLAYFDKYGAESINDCVFVSVGFDGLESIEAIFTGTVKFDSESVDRFANCYLATDEYADDPTFEAVRYFVTCLDYLPVLGFSADVLQKVYDGIKDGALKKTIRETVGSMPSFWSYIGDNSYKAAKKYVFGGYEDEYAGVIKKIDAFHDILVRWSSILDKAESDGARFYNVCKYGFQMLPVTGKDERMTDTIVTTKTSSLGATCSTVTGKLSSSYIQNADKKYISPDGQIDASTCKYPDHTWFVKNVSHRNMPNCFDEIYATIIATEGYTTVNELEDYPQFLVASDDSQTISPMTATNGNTQKNMETKPLDALFRFLSRVFTLILNKFAELFGAGK